MKNNLNHSLHLIGYASGIGGRDTKCGEGPLIIKNSNYLAELRRDGISVIWDGMITSPQKSNKNLPLILKEMNERLSKLVCQQIIEDRRLCVIGGDHTSAIGTWSGVYEAISSKGELGLIWIDAHMDCHTPQTTLSGKMHGMPLAVLLGYGDPLLTHINHPNPKIKPQNLCLIGVRSFESGEAELLQRLNVRIYFMEEIRGRGFDVVFKEAKDYITSQTTNYGISLDLDSLDPSEHPAVDLPEPDGISIMDIYQAIALASQDPKLAAFEIVEFNPSKDKDDLTERHIANILSIYGTRGAKYPFKNR